MKTVMLRAGMTEREKEMRKRKRKRMKKRKKRIGWMR